MTDTAPPPVPRPPVPLAATCLTLLLGAGLLTCLCAGGVVVGLGRAAEPRVAEGRAARAREAATQVRRRDAEQLLESVAARIAVLARRSGELPETLDEAPPKDPWGHAIEYDRAAPDRGLLRSAGPDGRFGTKDDVRREVVR